MSDDFAEHDPAWMEACRREEVIRELLRRYPGRITESARFSLLPQYWECLNQEF